MKQSFLLASFILFIFFQSSCSPKLAGDKVLLPPIIETTNQSQKYNLQLDMMKHHFSGMLIVRKISDKEIRILGSTYFGLSLFDFSLHNDDFIVNSCIAPMKKRQILLLLENDFKNLFLSNRNMAIKIKNNTFEKRTTGKRFGKSVFHLSEPTNGQANQIQIRHPWIRLSIQLNKLNENNF